MRIGLYLRSSDKNIGVSSHDRCMFCLNHAVRTLAGEVYLILLSVHGVVLHFLCILLGIELALCPA